MSEQEIYYREYVQSGRWAHPDAETCGCRGSGWWVSEVDTVHPCRFHENRPENHPDYDGPPPETVEARIASLHIAHEVGGKGSDTWTVAL